jgi:predicted Zn-dependent protease
LRRRRPLAVLVLGLAAATASLAAGEPYRHNRADYDAFRIVYPEVLEPNYVPFMLHEVPARPLSAWEQLQDGVAEWLGGPPVDVPKRLIVCRWAHEDLPLQVFIEPPATTDLGEDEMRPAAPEDFVAAVTRALERWEEDLEGLVAFAPVDSPEAADLHIRILGEVAPTPDPGVRVLGSAALGDSCEVTGGDPELRLDVRFRVSELRLYVADEHGLLLARQVESIALHEIGHALGMRGHSPLPSDLMYAVARDRIPRDGLGASDVNSFLSLYRVPNGTVYVDPASSPAELGVPAGPDGTVRLALAPHVDAGRGFEVQLPEGWTRLRSPYGVVAVNGVAWDHDASIQVNVHRMATIEEYLKRYGAAHRRDSRMLSRKHHEITGRRAETALLQTRYGTRERFTFVESGDGRLVVLIAECPDQDFEAYAPWFDAVAASVTLGPEDGTVHEYQPEAPAEGARAAPRP